jgi:HlyD family secretion protein
VIPVALATGLYGLNSWISPKIARSDVRTAVVEIGNVDAAFTASGLVVPESEQLLSSPVTAKIKSVLKQVGEPVAIGDQIVELDTEFLLMDVETLQDEYALKQSKRQQLLLDIESQKLKLQSQADIKQLNIEFLETKFQKEKRLHEMGLSPQAKSQEAQLELSLAQRELQLLQEQAANQEKQFQADLRTLELELKIQQKRLVELQKTIELAQAKSEYSGVLTWINANIGGSVRQGDVLAKIANLSNFKIEASVSDMHAEHLDEGGTVKVRINETDLPGRISLVRPAVENGVVKFVVEVDDPQHPLLKSNLRVDVFVVTSSASQVMRVENGPFYQGLTRQKVFIIEGSLACAREVTFGMSNFDYVEIKAGLQPGDNMIISDMEDYQQQQEIKLKE